MYSREEKWRKVCVLQASIIIDTIRARIGYGACAANPEIAAKLWDDD